MNWKRGLGIGLVFVGIFIMLTSVVITGNVVGFGSSDYLGLFGVLMFIVGAVLIFVSQQTLEEKLHEDSVDMPVFLERVSLKEPNRKKRALILDTSVLVEYSPEFIDYVTNNEEVYVPDSSIEEVKDADKQRLLQEKTFYVKGFEKFKDTARNILERTEKPNLRKKLLPYLDERKKLKKGDLSEYAKLKKVSERVRRIMAEEYGLDLKAAEKAPEYSLGKVREYLEKHCQVSGGDIDVLASAIQLARKKVHALIGERDIDLRQSVEIIKAEKPKLGKYIDFVEVYKNEYHTDKEKIEKYRQDAKQERKTKHKAKEKQIGAAA